MPSMYFMTLVSHFKNNSVFFYSKQFASLTKEGLDKVRCEQIKKTPLVTFTDKISVEYLEPNVGDDDANTGDNAVAGDDDDDDDDDDEFDEEAVASYNRLEEEKTKASAAHTTILLEYLKRLENYINEEKNYEAEQQFLILHDQHEKFIKKFSKTLMKFEKKRENTICVFYKDFIYKTDKIDYDENNESMYNDLVQECYFAYGMEQLKKSIRKVLKSITISSASALDHSSISINEISDRFDASIFEHDKTLIALFKNFKESRDAEDNETYARIKDQLSISLKQLLITQKEQDANFLGSNMGQILGNNYKGDINDLDSEIVIEPIEDEAVAEISNIISKESLVEEYIVKSNKTQEQINNHLLQYSLTTLLKGRFEKKFLIIEDYLKQIGSIEEVFTQFKTDEPEYNSIMTEQNKIFARSNPNEVYTRYYSYCKSQDFEMIIKLEEELKKRVALTHENLTKLYTLSMSKKQTELNAISNMINSDMFAKEIGEEQYNKVVSLFKETGIEEAINKQRNEASLVQKKHTAEIKDLKLANEKTEAAHAVALNEKEQAITLLVAKLEALKNKQDNEKNVLLTELVSALRVGGDATINISATDLSTPYINEKTEQYRNNPHILFGSQPVQFSATENNIETNNKKIKQFFKSDFRYLLALSPDLTVNDDRGNQITNFQDLWLKSLNIDNISSENVIDIIRFLFVDTYYEQWKDHTEFGDYSFLVNAIKTYSLVYDLNETMGKNFDNQKVSFYEYFVRKIRGDDKYESPYTKDFNVTHIGDLIAIYDYFKSNTEQRNVGRMNVISSVLNTYYNLLEKGLTGTSPNIFWALITNNTWKSDNLTKILKPRMRTINSDRIMTILKINNYSKTNPTEIPSTWNKSYIPLVSSDNQFLKLTIQNEKTSNAKDILKTINKNNENFTFGGFTRIFRPRNRENPDEIKEMTDDENTGTKIQNKIVRGEVVFVFGYGASGSGKTTMLIYNDKTEKKGFSIELCNEIAKKITAIGGTNIKITATTRELYIGEIKANNNNEFKVNGIRENKSTFHGLNDEEFSYDSEKNNFGDLAANLTFFITIKREVFATRNNKDSSRSHVLCFLKFSSSNGPHGTMIIADLAGVENSFDYRDCDTIAAMYDANRKPITNTDAFGFIFRTTTVNSLDKILSESLKNKIRIEKTSDYSFLQIYPFAPPVMSGTLGDEEDLPTIYRDSTTDIFVLADGITYSAVEAIRSVNKPNSLVKFNENVTNLSIMKPNTQTDFFDKKTETKTGHFLPTKDKTGLRKYKKQGIYSPMSSSEYMTVLNEYAKRKNFNYDKMIQTVKKMKDSRFIRDALKRVQIADIYEMEKNNTVIENRTNNIILNQINEIIIDIKKRAQEGDYINSDLKALRNEMIESMISKSNGSLFTAPTIDTSCLSNHCNEETPENCYMIRKKKTQNSSYSLILKTVAAVMNPTPAKTVPTQIKKILNSMNIVIFTVFNISSKDDLDRIDNTTKFTEPTQYIDINPLKSYIRTNNTDKVASELSYIKRIFQNSKPDRHISLQISPLRSDQRFLEILKDIEQSNDTTVQEFIEFLDFHNASTPLGTLAFTDNLAKFGIDQICKTDEASNLLYSPVVVTGLIDKTGTKNNNEQTKKKVKIKPA